MDESLIERLREADCYPGNPAEVFIIQTHLSVVCVAGDNVYKLKKPVKLPFVDYSTRELREHFCHEEVRLNRRLSKDVYRGVARLVAGSTGATFREESGDLLDHAVHMRRLPEGKMLNELLARGEVSAEEIREVARIVAGFHGRADRGPEILSAGDPERLCGYALGNFSETREQCGEIFDPELHAFLENRARSDFDALLPRLKARAAAGLVVDGHGDLHARNICMTDPPAIYDCIEFCAGFRCEDVATENAFLVMDLMYRGRPDLAGVFLDAYIEESGDEDQRGLMPALVRYRAMVRAKVSAIAAGEHELAAEDRAEAVASARRHLNLTAASAIGETGAVVVLACGLPATGKSYVFDELARETSWPCFASDKVRKELAGEPEAKTLPAEFYSEANARRIYDEMLRRADGKVSSTPVLLDATFRSKRERGRVMEMAKRAGADVFVVWFRAGESEIRERMAFRARDSSAVSDADLAVYEKLKTAFEAPRIEEGFGVIELGRGESREESVARILSVVLKSRL